MQYSANNLARIQRATGIKVSQNEIDRVLTLQSAEQSEQFLEDIQKVVFIYEDSLTSNGEIKEQYAAEWDYVCERIGIWFSYLSMLEPKRRGWFGKKEIPFPAKMMLSRVLSPDAPIMKSGLLDI
jgi:hypothetical protein